MIAPVMSLRPIIPHPQGLGVLRCRDYQNAAVDAVYRDWQEADATLLVLATGLGKTVCAAEVICRWPGEGRWMFVSHLREINLQTVESIGRHIGERPALEMGQDREERLGHGIQDRTRVLVTSVQTMVRRMQEFNPEFFDGIIFDEAHHAAAASYRRIWRYFSEGNPQLRGLLITATPNRTDGLTLGCIAKRCAYEMPIHAGIEAGWLVPIQQKFVRISELDFSRVKTRRTKEGETDFVDDDIAEMMDGKIIEGMSEEERDAVIQRAETICHRIAQPTIEEAGGRQGIIFCASVAQAERMAEILRRPAYGVNAAVVVGSTSDEERRDTIERFRAGLIQFLCLCHIGTEGFDVPNVSVVAMGRPTKSLVIYTQKIGRATRPMAGLVDQYDTPEERRAAIAASGKPFCTVLDFVGNSGRHKLVSTADVLAGDMPEDLRDEAVYMMQVSGETAQIRERIHRRREEREAERERVRQAIEEQRRKAREEQERRAHIAAQVQYKAEEVSAFARGEVKPDRVQDQYRGGSTDGQINLLKRLGVSEATAMRYSKRQAGAVIDRLQSQRGKDWIMRFGKHTGKTLADIQRVEPEYFRWMVGNLNNPEFLQNVELFREQWKRGER